MTLFNSKTPNNSTHPKVFYIDADALHKLEHLDIATDEVREELLKEG